MKTTLLLLASAFLTGTLHAEFRTWTRTDGKTATLDLIGSSGEEGEKMGRFKMRNGRSLELPASDFVEAGAELINQWEAPAMPGAEAADRVSVFDKVLEGNLEQLSGKRLKRHTPESKPKKYYVFYYTASWCGPCQNYTPSLVGFYNKMRPDNDNFELVLISSDRDEKAMEGYAKDKEMPWPQLKFSKVKAFRKEFDHGVTGIPSVVVCDLQGNIVAKTTSLASLENLLK